MTITAEQVGKKYRREWIFRRVDLTLSAGQSYTFVGPNGSGKSTLLQLLMGSLPLSEGTLTYAQQGQPISADHWYRHVVVAAPYLELIEELTLRELLDFHQQFRPLRAGLTTEAVAEQMQLSHALGKEIKFFSSGMKQRAKLGLAFCTDADVVVLDEPTSNLDRAGATWYHQQVRQLAARPEQLLLIGSNVPAEYDFCPNVVDITRWK